MIYNIFKFSVLIFMLSLGRFAVAFNEATQTFTLDGILYKKGTTTPLSDSGALLKIQIIDPTGSCLLYEEQQTVNTMLSKGYFSVNVGSATSSTKRTVNDPGRNMAQVFQNTLPITANSVPGQTCSGAVYSPSAGDVRYFRITVTPSGTAVADVLTPDIVVDSVPQALVAQSLQGLERANVLQVNNTGSTVLTQTNLEAVFTTPGYANLQAILAGNFMHTDSSGATLPSYASAPSGLSTGDMWYDSTTNQIKYQSNSGVQTLGTSSGGISSMTTGSAISINGSVAGTVSSGSATIDLSNTGVTAGTYAKVTVDVKGRVTAGSVSLTEAELPVISTAGKVSGNAITSGTISGSAAFNTSGNLVTTGTVSGLTVQATNLRIYNGSEYVQLTAQAMSSSISFALPTADGISGQVLSTNGSGALSWITQSGGTSGTISVGQGGTGTTSYTANRLIASNGTGTALVGTSCSLNQVISFDASGNITCANVSSLASMILNGGNTTSGTISIGSNDNQALQFKTNNTVAMTISQSGYVGIGTASPQGRLEIGGSMSSAPSVQGKYLNLSSVTLTDNTTASFGNGIENNFNFIDAPVLAASGGFVSTTDSATLKIAGPPKKGSNNTAGNAVALDIGSTSLGGQINSYGLRVAASTGASNNYSAVFTGGNVGIGTPAPSSALEVSGAITALGMSSAPSVSSSNTGRIYYDYSANKFKVSQNGGAYADLVPASATTGFVNGGNSFGASATLGTTDNHSLSIKTNNTTAMTISQNGNVGIGTASPSYKLQVNGTASFSGQVNGSRLVSISNGSAALPGFAFTNGSDSGMFYDSANADLAFAAAGLEAMRIKASGNVGIGTTVASSILDISGAITAQGMSSAPSVSASNTGRIYYDYSANKFKVSQNGGAYADLVGGVSGTISVGQGGTNATSFTANRIIASNGTGSALQDFSCSLNQVISFDGSGNASCANVSSLANMILNGGNTTAAAISIGTNDNYPLQFKANNTVAMTISQGGYVGIGTTAPAQALEVVGTVQATDFVSTSDRRLKRDITSIDSALEKITQINGVTWKWISNGVTDVGVIAQDVEKVFPDLVATDVYGRKSVKYGNLAGPLIEAVKTLKSHNEALKEQINLQQRQINSLTVLKTENEELKKRMERLEKLMDSQATSRGK